MTGGKKRGRNINGIDLQSSLSCIRDAGRNHTISTPCTTPMSFRSIGTDPRTKGLGLSGCLPVGRAHCLALHFSPQYLFFFFFFLKARHCHPTANDFYITQQHPELSNFSIQRVQPQCVYTFHSRGCCHIARESLWLC